MTMTLVFEDFKELKTNALQKKCVKIFYTLSVFTFLKQNA